MQNFLTLSYWFARLPVPFMSWARVLVLALFGTFVVAGLALRIVAKRKKDSLYWRDGMPRLASALFQTGLIGLILVWVTQQQVAFFGMRIWFLVLAITFALRVALVIKRMIKDLPVKAAAYAEQARIRKYL